VDDLIAWLLLNVDQHERLARECIADVGANRKGDEYADGSGIADRDDFPEYPWGSRGPELAFMAGPGHPDSVLDDIDAKRKTLALHVRMEIIQGVVWCDYCTKADSYGEPLYAVWPCLPMRLLAWSFKKRPGWQEAWQPTEEQEWTP
jgi:hypothetical protein